MPPEKSNWQRILESITAPLGFFVLSLLIIEAFLATVLIAADLESKYKVTGMWLGVGMFVLVTIAVFFLVCFRAENLTFDKEAHLIDRGKAPFGTDTITVLDRDQLLPSEANNRPEL